MSYLDFDTESAVSAHVVPAKTTARFSDVPPNPRVKLAAAKREQAAWHPPCLQQLTDFLVCLPHDSSAGKYRVPQGSATHTKDHRGSTGTRICAHL